MVYLLRGLVFMKDNDGRQWPFRVAKIDEVLQPAKSDADYVDYKVKKYRGQKRSALHFWRRNDNPLIYEK